MMKLYLLMVCEEYKSSEVKVATMNMQDIEESLSEVYGKFHDYVLFEIWENGIKLGEYTFEPCDESSSVESIKRDIYSLIRSL